MEKKWFAIVLMVFLLLSTQKENQKDEVIEQYLQQQQNNIENIKQPLLEKCIEQVNSSSVACYSWLLNEKISQKKLPLSIIMINDYAVNKKQKIEKTWVEHNNNKIQALTYINNSIFAIAYLDKDNLNNIINDLEKRFLIVCFIVFMISLSGFLLQKKTY